MRYLTALLAACLSAASFAFDVPCLDPLACNFMEEGECFFTDENGDPCVIEGCTIEGACNYDPEADIYDGSCEVVSCLGCTDSEACNYDETALYDDASCIYYVDCNGTCGGNWIEDACGNCYSENAFSIDSLEELVPLHEWTDAFGEVSFVADFEGLLIIEIAGAKGGDSEFANGGLGAHFYDTLSVYEGDVFEIYLGEQPDHSSEDGAGGGGGTFLYQNSILVLAAGGGGGAGGYDETIPGDLQDGINGVLAECGSDGQTSSGEYFLDDGYGGCNGLGGTAGISHRPGGGGAGALTSGGTYSEEYGGGGYGLGGFSIENGFAGGSGENSHSNGGFGGGGGGSLGGGGGGGYSGGGGGTWSGYTDSDWGHGGGGGGSLRRTLLEDWILPGNDLSGILRMWNIGAAMPTCNPGCTYAQACNYNPESNFDDGSCDYCFCGEGTQWVDSLQACMVTEAAFMQACGEGTYWDDLAQACLTIETCQEDLDGDGVVGVNDLLDLLSSFGTECIPEPETAEWTCGEPVNYHGYDYATVQIGDQCWFAENLRTEFYQDGEAIPFLQSGWTQLSSPAFTSYNNDSELSDLYGFLYNWFAVAGDNVCPLNWRMSTQEDFSILHEELGGEEIAGGQMKAIGFEFWQEPNEGATNFSGLTALPGGWLNGGSDEFFHLGMTARWWTSSEYSEVLGVGHKLMFDQESASFPGVDKKDGYSVRCIKDSQ